MIRHLFIICFLTLLVENTSSQSTIPINIQSAINRGHRTIEGIPGINYFQNHADYKIEARFNPKRGKLKGSANITYFNNSPDTLIKLVLRLYQNIARIGGIRDEEWKAQNIHSGVVITALKINNLDIMANQKYRMKSTGTNLILLLPKSLSPNDSIKLEIVWNFNMPETGVHRYGKYDEGTYFISLWYPQVAVYDDIDGWDQMHYTGTHEFYNDFNNYDVRIKVPEGYMVWATGNWLNADKILLTENYRRLEKSRTSDEVIQIVTRNELADKRFLARKGSNVFHYKAEYIPDFAFGVADGYVWDAASVIADSLSNRRVNVHAVYDFDTEYFDSVAAYGCSLIREFINGSYNYVFPYDQITVFNGEGGMEYPMIVNNGGSFSRDGAVFLTMHELAHSYFPFLTGINERKYSWIDEGLTTFLTVETEKALQSNFYPLSGIVRNYQSLAGTEYDIPLSVPAYQTRGRAYIYYTYVRSSIAFHMLELYIGREDFRRGISEFISIWQNKHPTPYDLFGILKKNTSKDIDWYIDQWFFQNGWPDLGIENVEVSKDSISVEINCAGNFAVPLVISFHTEEGQSIRKQLGPEIWKTTKKYRFVQPLDMNIKEIRIGSDIIPDITPENNTFKLE